MVTVLGDTTETMGAEADDDVTGLENEVIGLGSGIGDVENDVTEAEVVVKGMETDADDSRNDDDETGTVDVEVGKAEVVTESDVSDVTGAVEVDVGEVKDEDAVIGSMTDGSEVEEAGNDEMVGRPDVTDKVSGIVELEDSAAEETVEEIGVVEIVDVIGVGCTESLVVGVDNEAREAAAAAGGGNICRVMDTNVGLAETCCASWKTYGPRDCCGDASRFLRS